MMSFRPYYPQRADSSDAGARGRASGHPVPQIPLANSVGTRESRQPAGVPYPQAERPGGAATPPASAPTTTSQRASGGSASHPTAAEASNDQPARTVNSRDERFDSSGAPISVAAVSSSPLGKIGNHQAENPSSSKLATSAATLVANSQYAKHETKPAEDFSRSAPPPTAGVQKSNTGEFSASSAKSATSRQRTDHHEADRPGTSKSQSPPMNSFTSPQLGRNGNIQAEGPRSHITPVGTRSATNGQHATIGNSHSQDLHGSVLSSAAEPDAMGQVTRPGNTQAGAAGSLTTSAPATKPVLTAQLAGTVENKQAGAPSGFTAPPSAAVPVNIKDSGYLAGINEGRAPGPSGAVSISRPSPDGKTKVEKAVDTAQPPDTSQDDDANVEHTTKDSRRSGDSRSELISKEEVEKEGSIQLKLKTRTFAAKLWNKGLGRRSTIEPLPNKMGELKENDVIIAVTGTLGEKGKRSFVDAVVGDNIGTSHNFESHDGRVHHTTFAHPHDSDRNVVLVYAMLSDEKLADSLRVISTLLSQSSLTEKNLAGIIYLEDIANSRALRSSQKDHKTLEKYLRGTAKINITFATIGWDRVKQEVEQQREKDVRERWKAFVQRGAGIIRFDGSSESAQVESAQAIVGPLISTADDNAADRPRKVYKGKEGKVDDIFMVDPRSTDIVIPIMGPTGVGKSTFINTVAGEAVAIVGHNLKSQTAHLQHVVLPYPKDRNRRIILVDTPGFDDTYVSDSEILRRIAVWLAKSYSANMKLSGVVYMHEISQTRMLGTSLKNLEMFQKLCGEEGMKNVILATTKWSEVPDEVGKRREQQLMERHWKPMLELGSELRRFTDTQQSGWDIIAHILKNVNTQEATDAVAIQQELVEIDKILPETDAGQMLRYTLEELLESQKQTTAQLRNDEGNPELRSMLEENKKKISATVQQLRALNIPFTRRLWSFFSSIS